MIEFKRNKYTGEVEVWRDGKKIGEIKTIADEIDKIAKEEERKTNG